MSSKIYQNLPATIVNSLMPEQPENNLRLQSSLKSKSIEKEVRLSIGLNNCHAVTVEEAHPSKLSFQIT
jgi:hypothetical protein